MGKTKFNATVLSIFCFGATIYVVEKNSKCVIKFRCHIQFFCGPPIYARGFLFWAHHDINMLYAFRKRASKVLPGNTSRFHINTKPEDPKSTPHPKWKVWQLSGNMVVEVIPGIDSNGMCIFQKGLVDRFTPTVALHAASSPKQCQSVASQRWHFSLQLKPQLRWKPWMWTIGRAKGQSINWGYFQKIFQLQSI